MLMTSQTDFLPFIARIGYYRVSDTNSACIQRTTPADLFRCGPYVLMIIYSDSNFVSGNFLLTINFAPEFFRMIDYARIFFPP